MLVYGVHGGEDPQTIKNFIKQTGVSFPIVVDQGNTLNQFAFPAGVGYPYPRDIVIGKDLKVRAIRNSFNVGEMSQLVDALLKE